MRFCSVDIGALRSPRRTPRSALRRNGDRYSEVLLSAMSVIAGDARLAEPTVFAELRELCDRYERWEASRGG